VRCTLATIRLRRPHDDTIIGVGLDMLLEILGTFECFATELALVGLEWNVDTDVGGDVVAFDCGRPALTPSAGQIEVVCRLTTNMALADVFLNACEMTF
jgi:hypothetical protein